MKRVLIIISSFILIIGSILIFKEINDKKFYEIYEVSFNTLTDNIIDSQYIKKNGKVKKPKDPYIENNEFIEWTYLGKKFDFNTKINKRIILKAKYKNKVKDYKEYKVKFINEKNITEEIVKENTKVLEPISPKKEGYNFLGWYIEDKLYNFDYLVGNDINLVAKYEEIPKKEETRSYKVIFNTNGGNKINNITVKRNDKIPRPKDPVKEGYKFTGWYYKNKIFDFNRYVTCNVELIAGWEKVNTNKYQVTFKIDNNTKTIEVLENNKIQEPETPIKEGYNFKEWLYNGTKFDFNTNINKDIILEASFIKKNYKIIKEEQDNNIKINLYEDNKLISFKEIKDINNNILCTGNNNIISKDKLPNILKITLLDNNIITINI